MNSDMAVPLMIGDDSKSCDEAEMRAGLSACVWWWGESGLRMFRDEGGMMRLFNKEGRKVRSTFYVASIQARRKVAS